MIPDILNAQPQAMSCKDEPRDDRPQDDGLFLISEQGSGSEASELDGKCLVEYYDGEPINCKPTSPVPVAIAQVKPLTVAKSMAEKSYINKKPKDKPMRSLSAYNFFFRAERARIMNESSVESMAVKNQSSPAKLFASVGKTVAKRWKNVTAKELAQYKNLADGTSCMPCT
jgi:hypothetical protein